MTKDIAKENYQKKIGLQTALFDRIAGFLLSFICPIFMFFAGSQTHQSLRDWIGK